MKNARLLVRALAITALLGGAWACLGAATLEGAQAKEEKKDPKKRGGTVIGELTGKGDNYIEVKADGEEKARRYVPHWVGGVPAKGGGFDKKILQKFRELKVGSRVRLEWVFEERPRVVSLELLKGPDGKAPEKGKEKGQ